MNQEHEELIYEGVRRMVTWDEPHDDVFHHMEVNGITGAKANEMYAKARAERVQAIPSESISTAVKGLLLLMAGLGIFSGPIFYQQGTTRNTVVISTVAIAFGGWRFFKGIFGYAFATSKEGSLADEE